LEADTAGGCPAMNRALKLAFARNTNDPSGHFNAAWRGFSFATAAPAFVPRMNLEARVEIDYGLRMPPSLRNLGFERFRSHRQQ
jgi:hypothetical protein